MKARRFRSRSILLGAGVATASLALVVLPALGFSAWNSSVSVSKTISAATVPTPGSASWNAVSTTTSSSYPATYDGYHCPPVSGYTFDRVDFNNGFGEQCVYTTTNQYAPTYYYYPINPEYSCPDGGSLSGSTCITETTTPDIRFTWTTPTAYDASGQDFVTGVDVVEGSSCSTSSWTVVATESPSVDSYTVDNPSTSEYYGLQTKGLGGWTSTVSGCTLG
jgi:hypothetical protein